MSSNQSKLLKFLLYVLIIFCLVLPMLQTKYKLVETEPLAGAITPAKNAKLSWSGWFTGQYQEKKEKYVNEAFGFRTTLVRLNNQMAFTFYKEAKANDVIIGKKNYLFEKKYIESYYGRDCMGKDSAKMLMQQLRYVQDQLELRGKTVLAAFAAGKASYYAEYIPDNLKSKPKHTNYELLTKYAEELGVHYIDFNKLFLRLKPKVKYPLFPRYGIHWSEYSGVMVADSLLGRIGKQLNTKLDSLVITGTEVREASKADSDIGKGMNLLFGFPEKQMYAKTKWVPGNGKKPKLVSISDSYFWAPWSYNLNIPFSRVQYWFYNIEAYSYDWEGMKNVSDLNFERELKTNDVFIIMSTEANFHGFGCGFIQKAYKYYREHPFQGPFAMPDRPI